MNIHLQKKQINILRKFILETFHILVTFENAIFLGDLNIISEDFL